MNKLFLSLMTMSVAACCGCGTQTAPSTPETPARPTPSAAGREYMLDAEPAGAESILRVREESKDGDDVVLVGRIGGDVNPWVEGRAAFSLVDLSAKACSDIPGDSCPTPWDYCCETDKLAKGKTLVKFMDADGKPVAEDARQLLGVKELDTLVVHGKAQRDESGNLTILASKVFVRPSTGQASSAGNDAQDHGHDHKHEGEHDHKHEHDHAGEKPSSSTDPADSQAAPPSSDSDAN